MHSDVGDVAVQRSNRIELEFRRLNHQQVVACLYPVSQFGLRPDGTSAATRDCGGSVTSKVCGSSLSRTLMPPMAGVAVAQHCSVVIG